MIEIIVAAVGGSLTCITCTSLWFASVLDKRERKEIADELKREEKERNGAEAPSVKIYPYEFISMKALCPLCGAGGNEKSGPKFPHACNKAAACPAWSEEHLHVECMSCKGTWFMKPKTVIK